MSRTERTHVSAHNQRRGGLEASSRCAFSHLSWRRLKLCRTDARPTPATGRQTERADTLTPDFLDHTRDCREAAKRAPHSASVAWWQWLNVGLRVYIPRSLVAEDMGCIGPRYGGVVGLLSMSPVHAATLGAPSFQDNDTTSRRRPVTRRLGAGPDWPSPHAPHIPIHAAIAMSAGTTANCDSRRPFRLDRICCCAFCDRSAHLCDPSTLDGWIRGSIHNVFGACVRTLPRSGCADHHSVIKGPTE